MKILFVLQGASFREGGQFSTTRGTPGSYNEQMEACKSHMFFFDLLIRNGYDVNVLINTYHTDYIDDLKNIYGNYLKETSVHHNLLGLENLFLVSLDMICRNNLNEYDLVYFIRIDLLLKPTFTDAFMYMDNKIRVSFICTKIFGWHCIKYNKRIIPRIADMLLQIPKKYFYLIENKRITLTHHTYEDLLNNGIPMEEIDFMLDTYHDSDSAKDYNPFYRIVNRPENRIWLSEGSKIYEDNTFECISYRGQCYYTTDG